MKGYVDKETGADCAPCRTCIHKAKMTVESPCYNCISNVDLALHKPNHDTDFVNYHKREGAEE